MYSATANRARARARVSKRCRWYISFFRVAKNDSAAALSQHTPVRPTLVRMLFVGAEAGELGRACIAQAQPVDATPLPGGVGWGESLVGALQ